MKNGLDLNDDATRTDVFDDVAFRVRFLDENEERIHGTCVINLAKLKYAKDWTRIRGRRIATVFQDPMTSLNPIITIGKQISSIIMKHQDCSEVEARARAIEMMRKVGIPNAENRYDDYPLPVLRRYASAYCYRNCAFLPAEDPHLRRAHHCALTLPFRHRFSSSSKICRKNSITRSFSSRMTSVLLQMLPTALQFFMQDRLLKSARPKRSSMTRVIRTHGHCSPSLPQLAQRDTELFSITGTPPSLYNKIAGDPFAPRNPYCLKIDVVKAPPMFKITETHYAKTWLLDPRAPKIDKPAAIDNIHDKMIKAFNI